MDFQIIDVDMYNAGRHRGDESHNRLPVLVERDLVLYSRTSSANVTSASRTRN
jgi:hypothetical protein